MIFGFTTGLCALIMIAIGIYQWRSKMPATFYSGEKPLDATQLSDVSAWNRKHGMMWILYGIIITGCGCLGFVMGNNTLFLLPFLGGIIIPPILMALYHEKLKKEYML